MTAPWEGFLREHFPGYLLPETRVSRIDPDEAALFLARMADRPHALLLVRAAALVAGNLDAIEALAVRELPDLVRGLPSTTEARPRRWEGGFQGRLDAPATQALNLMGAETAFITRARRRHFALPENRVLRHVAGKLLATLVSLDAAGVSGGSDWGVRARGCDLPLRTALHASALRQVPDGHLDAPDLAAAAHARHPAYRRAASLYGRIRDTLDARDPARVAALLAEGALVPLKDWTRFEVAVLLRLVQAMHARLDRTQPGRWRLERAAFQKGRADVAALLRDDGVAVRFFHNQSLFEPGQRERGLRHYFSSGASMRPDITLRYERPGSAPLHTVVEVKLSDKPEYVASGYEEALLYAYEYADRLRAWPRAILVASGVVTGSASRAHPVVAIDWARWVPEVVLDGLVEGL
ncbi:MAG: hypothetical protein V4850_32380 [Myxococcota bacterium]